MHRLSGLAGCQQHRPVLAPILFVTNMAAAAAAVKVSSALCCNALGKEAVLTAALNPSSPVTFSSTLPGRLQAGGKEGETKGTSEREGTSHTIWRCALGAAQPVDGGAASRPYVLTCSLSSFLRPARQREHLAKGGLGAL